MGIFSKLFGRRQSTWEPAPPPPPPAPKISAEQQAAVDALLEKMGGGDLSAWVAPAPPVPQEPVPQPVPEPVAETVANIAPPPDKLKAEKRKPARPKPPKRLAMVYTSCPKEQTFAFYPPADLGNGISSLGVDNPDFALDEAKLRRKGYLFKEVFAKKFAPLAAELSIPQDRGDDPDALAIAANGVPIGTLDGAWGAEVSLLLHKGAIASVQAQISGGDCVVLECDPEYDETSKRIPTDALYKNEDVSPYRIDLTVKLGEDVQTLTPAKKVKQALAGVDSSALEGCRQSRFSPAGCQHYMDNIRSLGRRSQTFGMTAEELAAAGLANLPAFEYEFPEVTTELVPEPSNLKDPNAIKVLMDGILVGYIPAKRCPELLTQLRQGRVKRVQGGILCESFRMLAAPGTGENVKPEEMQIYREDGDIKVKLFIDIAD